ncbi:hypothetical protein MNBD_ALPHA07-1598 [hydrothermal vent metagenome]|uniref:Uncharacterized protein n=1 Tax=hydrothermal vent metagenome TaxID=652676 RepID=A0A3B0RFU4_9ZZZZ
MVSKATVDKTIARLDQALASGDMPPAAYSLAERISKRLKSPVRLAIMGLPGSGKSRLLNFLTGTEVIPKNVKLPSVLVAWGKVKKIDCTLADGKTKSLDSFDIKAINQLKPVFIRLKLPLPVLKKISILEVNIGTHETEQKRALTWAARSTDLAIWCTQDFTKAEIKLWNTLPSALHDHSLLVMTKADAHSDKDTRAKKLGALRSAAAKLFSNVHPIDTLQALAARGKDGVINESRLAKSGGQDLLRAVLHAVDQGIQASLDGAVILFTSYQISDLATPAQKTPEPEQSKPEAPPDEPTELLVPKEAPTPPPDRDDFNSEIVTYLADRVKELQTQLSESDALDSEMIMAQCYEYVEGLVEQLTTRAANDPDILHTLDACQDAADMMLLLQLENQDSAVEDAVVLLLQIKRDFEQKIAA